MSEALLSALLFTVTRTEKKAQASTEVGCRSVRQIMRLRVGGIVIYMSSPAKWALSLWSKYIRGGTRRQWEDDGDRDLMIMDLSEFLLVRLCQLTRSSAECVSTQSSSLPRGGKKKGAGLSFFFLFHHVRQGPARSRLPLVD